MDCASLRALAEALSWRLAHVIASLGLLIVTWAAVVVVYRLFLHPLAGIPGPRRAAVSNIWHALQVRNGRLAQLASGLHKRYGQAVRVGPNEVWFCSKEAYDQIYGTCRGLEKSDFYLATCLIRPRLDWRLRPSFLDTLDLLSERNMRRYRLQRRLIGRTYHASNIIKFEGAVDGVLDRANETLAKLEGQPVDLTEWMHILAVECLGACVLSWSPGMLRDGTDWGTITHSYHGWRRKSVFGLFPLAAKLEIVNNDFGRAFGKLWGVTYRTPPRFKPFFTEVHKRVVKRLKSARRPAPPKDDRKDLLADLIQLHKDKPEFTEAYLKKMAVTNFGAGHETMASTLTSIMALLGSYADVQKKVVQDIRECAESKARPELPDFPYTRAVIKEAMRLRPVIAMSLPRQVSASGLDIHQWHLPAGTTVGCHPMALHRNERIFGTDSDIFKPERWLSADGDLDRIRLMDRYNLSWGGGSRSCPGRHLAELVVLKVVTRLLDRFEVETDVPPEGAQRSYFLSMLTGVQVRFFPRQTMRA